MSVQLKSPHRTGCLGFDLFKSSNYCRKLFISVMFRFGNKQFVSAFQADFNQVQLTVSNKVHTLNSREV